MTHETCICNDRCSETMGVECNCYMHDVGDIVDYNPVEDPFPPLPSDTSQEVMDMLDNIHKWAMIQKQQEINHVHNHQLRWPFHCRAGITKCDTNSAQNWRAYQDMIELEKGKVLFLAKA